MSLKKNRVIAIKVVGKSIGIYPNGLKMITAEKKRAQKSPSR